MKEKRKEKIPDMYCYHCGNKLEEQAHFCDKCGMAVRREAQVLPPSVNKEGEQKETVKKKKSAWIVILISLTAFVLLVVLAVCVVRTERGAKKTLEKYRAESPMYWDENEADEDEFWDDESEEYGIWEDNDREAGNSF